MQFDQDAARIFAANDRMNQLLIEHLDPAAWELFTIVFLWQFPHFTPIAWMYRRDYGAGDNRTAARQNPAGRPIGSHKPGLIVRPAHGASV